MMIHEISTNFPIHPRFAEACDLAAKVLPENEFQIKSVIAIDDYKDRPVALILAVSKLDGQYNLVTLPNFDLSNKTLGKYKTEEIAKHIAQNWLGQYNGL